jgi:hypothetical protein
VTLPVQAPAMCAIDRVSVNGYIEYIILARGMANVNRAATTKNEAK